MLNFLKLVYTNELNIIVKHLLVLYEASYTPYLELAKTLETPTCIVKLCACTGGLSQTFMYSLGYCVKFKQVVT